jgi:hypothetical protein
MGFKAWRNLGFLALAGASLVGCTSTTPQSAKFVAPTPQNNSYNVPPGQTPPPNQNVFGTQQQFAPNANGGFDNQPRQTVQGFPQTGGPNPNPGFNTSSGGQNYISSNPPAPGIPPSNPANSYIAAPNGSSPQSYYNPGLQANPGNVGATGTQNPYAGGNAPSAVPSMPSFPPGPPTGSFTPPPAPTGFGTSPR